MATITKNKYKQMLAEKAAAENNLVQKIVDESENDLDCENELIDILSKKSFIII